MLRENVMCKTQNTKYKDRKYKSVKYLNVKCKTHYLTIPK